MFDGFEHRDVDLATVTIRVRVGGSGPPVLLLHGFPQTHVMWHAVAPALAARRTVVCADLRGYGDSSKPHGGGDHAAYAKRTLAQDMVDAMTALGFERFSLVGHDRGARVGHRLALDHPERLERLALLDICPTATMYARTDFDFAQAYWHWFFLTQPEPLPETLLAGDPPWALRWFLGAWGSGGLGPFADDALAEYERCWATAEGIHASCEDYRAAATIDLEHDRQSDAERRRIGCPLLVLWGARGVVARLFDPLADWRAVSAGPISGSALPCGHFLAEEAPEALLAELEPFLT